MPNPCLCGSRTGTDKLLLPFSKGEKVRVKAHGGPIDIQGVTVATVNDKVQLQKVETWFDPMEMFRQMVKSGGVVTKEPVTIPADVDSTESREATTHRSSVATATAGFGELKLSAKEEGTNTATVDVAENPMEGKEVPQEAAIENGQSSKSEPKEPSIPSADHLPAPTTSYLPQPPSNSDPSDAKTQSATHAVREEVIPPEETLEKVQTVADKELDVDLAEEKGKAGVYQSSGCPFLVTTADQNVLNRE